MRSHPLPLVLFAALALVACQCGTEISQQPPDPIVAKPADPAQSTVQVDRSEGVLADGADAVGITVHVVDTDGNPLAGVEV
ncbi:MAG: hypothetical protein ACK4N5_09960, partial [Myxococcales bacterium]